MNVKDIRNEATSDNKEFSEMYDDYIDEVSGDVQIGSLTYSASRVLREVDPVAYNCGFSDWLDSISDPYECECGSRYETEDEAEECCQSECDKCGEMFPDSELDKDDLCDDCKCYKDK